jgi:hypothetical protein
MKGGGNGCTKGDTTTLLGGGDCAGKEGKFCAKGKQTTLLNLADQSGEGEYGALGQGEPIANCQLPNARLNGEPNTLTKGSPMLG